MFARRWAVVEILDGRPVRIPGMLFWWRKTACKQAQALHEFAPLFSDQWNVRAFRIINLSRKEK